MPRQKAELPAPPDSEEPSSAPRAPLTLAIDIGGTKVALAIFDDDGRAVATHRMPTLPERGATRTIAAIAEEVRLIFGAHLRRVGAIGVAVAGQVAPGAVLVDSPNLGWSDLALGAAVERELGRPTVVLNDVRAATWGEWMFGAGRGIADVVVVFLGTGVGGGAVSGGRLLEGADQVLGEFGHMTLVAEGRPCHCLNRGCLEAYCGGWAIAERAQEAVRANPSDGATLLRLAGAVEAITAERIAAAIAAGDPFATAFIHGTAALLGAALVSLVNAFNPRRVILGGGVMDGFPEMLDAAAVIVHERALPAASRRVELRLAELGDQAPAIGAACAARSTLGPRLDAG